MVYVVVRICSQGLGNFVALAWQVLIYNSGFLGRDVSLGRAP